MCRTKYKIFPIFFCEYISSKISVRQVNTFTLHEYSIVFGTCINDTVSYAGNCCSDAAICYIEPLTPFNFFRKIILSRNYIFFIIAFSKFKTEVLSNPHFQNALKITNSNFRPLQIHHDSDRFFYRVTGFSNPFYLLGSFFVSTVTTVKSKSICTSLHHCKN